MMYRKYFTKIYAREGIMIRENIQVYIYSLVDKKVLLLKRTEERSGYWQPVCGGIEEI